jgi:hypothetical protein
MRATGEPAVHRRTREAACEVVKDAKCNLILKHALQHHQRSTGPPNESATQAHHCLRSNACSGELRWTGGTYPNVPIVLLSIIDDTKAEKEKLASTNGVLDSELRGIKDRQLNFVSEAIELVTLLNLSHGFTPRIGPLGKIELADMVEQLCAV